MRYNEERQIVPRHGETIEINGRKYRAIWTEQNSCYFCCLKGMPDCQKVDCMPSKKRGGMVFELLNPLLDESNPKNKGGKHEGRRF